MSFPKPFARASAHELPALQRSASAEAPNSVALRFVAFAVLHIALLALMYAAAMLNANGHELEANAYGAGRVEHLGRMTLHPMPSRGGQP